MSANRAIKGQLSRAGPEIKDAHDGQLVSFAK
jgi:hypothetical protein